MGRAILGKRVGTSVVVLLLATGIAAAAAAYTAVASGQGNSSAATQAIDPVLAWNQTLLGILRTPGAQPPTVHPTRSLALMHAAIYDAVESIDGRSAPYLVRVAAPRSASQPAAAAAAAHAVLVALYPQQRATLDSQLASSLASIANGPSKDSGVLVGQETAQRLLTWRAADGSNVAPVPYASSGAPGDYQPTPPALAAPVFTHWSGVTPFTLAISSQFQPQPPPPLASPAYAQAVQEVQALGSSNSVSRSAEQTEIGKFWGAPIQNYWNEIAVSAALARHTTTAQNARLFALLNLTIADSVIAFYDAKYGYRLWRPITAIRSAENDGNAATTGDPTWTPLAATAPDPSYPGAHSVVSAAGATVLSSFFGGDRFSFHVRSEVLPGVDRSFSGFGAAAEEAGLSRIYAGQHTRLDHVSGTKLGRTLAGFVLRNFLLPRRQDAAKATSGKPPIKVKVFAPGPGDIAGIGSKGFFVDLDAAYPTLASTGAGLQLTGPKAHTGIPPFRGAFGVGHDEKLPGLIVLLSTTTVGARNAQNIAGLFNLTGFTSCKENEVWDTWIAGDALFGRNVRSVLLVAVAGDKNGNGIYDDAPDVVPDANHDGHLNPDDLRRFGVASNIVRIPFQIRD